MARTRAEERRSPSPAPKIQGQRPQSVQSRKRKQSPYDTLDRSLGHKRQRTSSGDSTQTDPVEFWATEGRWPKNLFKPDDETPEMAPTTDHLLVRTKSSSNLLSRKRSNSATSTATPSDQKPREEKSGPYRDARYTLILQTKGSYMRASELGVTDASKDLVRDLLNGEQSFPTGTHFDDDIFVAACQNLVGANEARVVQDISQLIVPSAESLALHNKCYKHLVESVNAGWNNSIPLIGPHPQPDYTVGFKQRAFTKEQLNKLSPFIGNVISGDQSFFIGTYYIFFPFLTYKVKYGAGELKVTDRQNAHSITLAVRAIIKLFRAIKHKHKINRQILAFSISHNHKSVQIYGHYPVITGKNTEYYRHLICDFSFTELDGKDKWTAYRFTKNIYDIWIPAHFKRICSAIDQLLSEPDFDIPPLSDTGPVSEPVEQDAQSSTAGQQGPIPDTTIAGPEVAKKRRV